MADALGATSMADGEVVVTQGEPGNDFFIIVEGTAVVTQYRNEGDEPVEVKNSLLQSVLVTLP